MFTEKSNLIEMGGYLGSAEYWILWAEENAEVQLCVHVVDLSYYESWAVILLIILLLFSLTVAS